MGNTLWVGLGGFIGSILRYAAGGFVNRIAFGSVFPYGTFIVNAAGCLAVGLLAGIAETRGFFSEQTKMFLFVGVIGGFTTFSTFAFESLQLLKGSQGILAMINLVFQCVLGLAGVWAGQAISRLVS